MNETRATPDDPEDDGELELEPVDPEILAHQREQVAEKARRAEAAIEFDDLYDRPTDPDPIDLDTLKNFRFTTRHLLIVTAVVAIYFTLISVFNFAAGTFVAFTLTVAYGWWYVRREERQREEELERRRAEFNQRMRKGNRGQADPAPAAPDVTFDEPPPPAEGPRVRFSVSELLIGMTVAAVVLACVRITGGADNLALLLGFVALGGLLVNALGFEPPRQVTLAWWWMLILYILTSVWAAVVG